MKKLTGLLAGIIFILAVAGSAKCEPSHTGKYYRESNGNDYAQLNADGTFVVEVVGMRIEGTYEVTRETVVLVPYNFFFPTKTGRITGDTIIDEKNRQWSKLLVVSER